MRILSLSVLFCLLIVASGCVTGDVTHFSGSASGDALKRVAEEAASEFTVTWVDDYTLRLSDWWPIHSVAVLGLSTFNADLSSTGGWIEGDFYLQVRKPLGIFRLDLAPGWNGAVIKPLMRRQMARVLEYAGASVDGGDVQHGLQPSVVPDP